MGLLDYFSSPGAQGLLGLSAGLLQGGGPSPVPTNFGQSLGKGLLLGSQMMNQATDVQGRDALRKMQMQTGQQQLETGQFSLDQARNSQQAIEAFAQQLPPDQQGVFRANPAAYIKSMTERHKLGAGDTLISGSGQTIASAPALPTLQNLPVPGQPGVTQGMWLRPGETQGPVVGAPKMPEILNPQVQAAKRDIAGAGATRVQQNVQSFVPFNERLQGEMATNLVKEFDTLKNVPDQIAALDVARESAQKAGAFVGSGANAKLEVAKFLNNNLGTKIAPEEVKNAEVFRSAAFRMVLDNLKKMDAQPSERQQEALQKAMGRLDTDPSALPQVIDLTKDILLSRAKEHNRRVDSANTKGAKFMYDIRIPMPEGRGPGGLSKSTMDLLDKYAPQK